MDMDSPEESKPTTHFSILPEIINNNDDDADDVDDTTTTRPNDYSSITSAISHQYRYLKTFLIHVVISIFIVLLVGVVLLIPLISGNTPQPVKPTTVIIDVGKPLVNSSVNEGVLGVNQGPHIEGKWLQHLPRKKVSGDWTAGMARVSTPMVRTHGMGCVDLDQLWIPCSGGPHTGCTFIGYDPWDDSNYNWEFSDACLKNIYENPKLPNLKATIRFGHSRGMERDYPSFCKGVDDVEIFANVTAKIIHRYLKMKNYPVTDFSVWNEPTNSEYLDNEKSEIKTIDAAAGKDSSPFYCKSPVEYGQMYGAIWKRNKQLYGNKINIGIATDRGDYSKVIYQYLQKNKLNFDFIDTHIYSETPSLLPWNIHKFQKKGGGGDSLEDTIASYGFPSNSRIQIGEWSRTIPMYAQDIPGAAYVACGFIYLNEMTFRNSNGMHNVANPYLYSIQKIWDGSANDPNKAPDLNAATALNWWRRMVGGVHLTTSGGRKPYPMGDDKTVKDEVCTLAAEKKENKEILVLLSHYQSIGKNKKPEVGACFQMTVELKNIPYKTWSWTQYENIVETVLPVVNYGHGSGSSETLQLEMHGNSFSTLVIMNGDVAEGEENLGYPLDVAYNDNMKQNIKKKTCVVVDRKKLYKK